MSTGTSELPNGFRFDNTEPEEVQVMRDWAIAEGWNPGLNDLDLAYGFEPEAFIALRHGDELVGGGTIISYGDSFGFMGMFIVAPQFRGAGFGELLWRHRLAILKSRLSPEATIGMDGVYAMQQFYERGGFKFSHRDLRFEGLLQADCSSQIGAVVVGRDLSDVAIEAICRLDHNEWGISRSDLLRSWLRAPDVVVARIGTEVSPEGIAVLRPCERGWRFGPVIADGIDAARVLVATSTQGLSGQQVQFDIPEFNRVGLELAAELGLEVSFGCARMYHGPMPERPGPRAIGVMSFEFG